jgi:hypothetical protein
MSEETETQTANTDNGGSARTPPYISFQTLLTFLKALKTDGVPPQIDKSVLSKLSGGVQGQFKMALRSLGLMEGDKPTLAMKSLVDAYETPQFEAALLERLQTTYPYVFALDLMTATPTMFADSFKATGAKEDVLRKCRTFFLHAAKSAGVPLGNRIMTGSVPRAPSAGGTKRKPKAKNNEGEPRADHVAEGGRVAPKAEGFLGQLLSKFPDFDPNWSDELKAKWFAGFDQFMKSAKPK